MASITSTGKATLAFQIPADASPDQIRLWVTEGKITVEQALAFTFEQRDRAEKRAAAAEAQKRGGSSISFKVSKVGAVSVYGLQRWPVTLYRGQWERLLAKRDELVKFIADNAGALSDK